MGKIQFPVPGQLPLCPGSGVWGWRLSLTQHPHLLAAVLGTHWTTPQGEQPRSLVWSVATCYEGWEPRGPRRAPAHLQLWSLQRQ